MHNKLLIIVFTLFSPIILANSVSLNKWLEKPLAVGKTAKMTFLFWDVYDITLYADNGKYIPNKPFILKLTYLRDLKGEDIAKRSVEEITQQGFNDTNTLSLWLNKMQVIFPNVMEGDSLYGVRNKEGFSEFYHNEKFVGVVKDRNFTVHFFDIWLGVKTSEPKMRKLILNL